MSWATRYKASITNQNQGGGNKKEGLPPSVGTGNLNVWNGMTRAYGTPKDRELQVCINQLGSVNPRVYQSRYCGKITSGDGGEEPRDCDPSFEMDINQWESSSFTNTSRYDICFIMDKSGSMGTQVQQGITRWDRTKDFVKLFHRQLLLRQTETDATGTTHLLGSLTYAPTSVDPNDGKASSYFDVLHRLCFVSFQTNSEYNISYNTYVSQIYQPNEAIQTPDPNSTPPGEVFPITEGRFAAIIDALQVAGGTNAHLGLDDAIDMHINQSPYIGPSGDPTDLITTCGNYMQRDQNPAYAPFVGQPVAPFNGCLPGDIVTTINQLPPSNFTATPGVTFPNNFDETNSNVTQQHRLPPFPYPLITGNFTPFNGSGYRNGWRACNTILILLTDGAVNSVPLFNTAVNGVDTFETATFPASRIDPDCTLTRIGIGLGQAGSGTQIDNFAWGSVVSANDPFHRSIQNVPITSTGISDLVNEVLESITIVNFTLTSEQKYIELYLNQNEERICSYTDQQFLDEVIEGDNGIVENFNLSNWELTTLDLTGQIHLTSLTLINLLNANVDFKKNIRTLILDGCIGMNDSAIFTQDAAGTTAGPLMEIMNHSDLVNLVLSNTGITSAGIELLVNGFTDVNVNFINGVKQSKTLKYLNVDGINLSGPGAPPAVPPLENIMIGLANVGPDSKLECLSMRRCSIENIMLTNPNYLQSLIISATSTSKLVHIHLDQNGMDTSAVQTFVNTLNVGTLISTLNRIFIQFQTTPVTGGTPLPAPTTASLADWTSATSPLLQIDANNDVINGQYTNAEVTDINAGPSRIINGSTIPIFVGNGYTQANLYQAWVEIPVGSNTFHVGSTYPYPIPANWIEPGIFNHNNPTPVLGKVINP